MADVVPMVSYEDCAAAADWLVGAFGFEETDRFEDEGAVTHVTLRMGDGFVFLGTPGEAYVNPKQLGAATVLLYIYVDDVDAHCDRARAAGAEIANEPADQPYGERTYDARDPEGHSWYFAEQIRG